MRGRPARWLDSLIRNHINAVPLGGRRLAAVLPSDVQAWAADRGKVLAPATLRKLVSLLRSVYADAVWDRRVEGSRHYLVDCGGREQCDNSSLPGLVCLHHLNAPLVELWVLRRKDPHWPHGSWDGGGGGCGGGGG